MSSGWKNNSFAFKGQKTYPVGEFLANDVPLAKRLQYETYRL